MAKISVVPTIAARITIELSESEAAALDAIVGYGSTAFLKVFYEHMGKRTCNRTKRGYAHSSIQCELAKPASDTS